MSNFAVLTAVNVQPVSDEELRAFFKFNPDRCFRKEEIATQFAIKRTGHQLADFEGVVQILYADLMCRRLRDIPGVRRIKIDS